VHLEAMHGNHEWLLKFVRHNLKVNETVSGAPFYTKEEFQNLKSINVDHLLYLKKDEQKRITYMLANLMELESLFDGFCCSALEVQNQKCKLPKEKFDFMKSRAERIHALVNLFPKQISKIENLLDVYDSKIPPEALVKGVWKEKISKNTGQGIFKNITEFLFKPTPRK